MNAELSKIEKQNDRILSHIEDVIRNQADIKRQIEELNKRLDSGVSESEIRALRIQINQLTLQLSAFTPVKNGNAEIKLLKAEFYELKRKVEEKSAKTNAEDVYSSYPLVETYMKTLIAEFNYIATHEDASSFDYRRQITESRARLLEHYDSEKIRCSILEDERRIIEILHDTACPCPKDAVEKATGAINVFIKSLIDTIKKAS